MPRPRILGPCLALALAAPLAAQMHHVDQPKSATRALGVYEWTGDLAKPDAARLIPVSLFINGHYEDAGVFLAEPIPLALDTGNVYSIQRSGDPIGTVDLDFARDIVDRRDVADDNPIGSWYGYGRFLPLTAQPVKKLTEYSGHPATIVGSNDDERPQFVPSRNPAGDTQTASAKSPAPPNDPDRPQLTRRDSSSASDNAPASPGTADIDDPDRPTLGRRNIPDDSKKKKHSKDSGSYVEAMPTSLNNDPDRPDLHTGKVQSATAPPQLHGVPPNLHQAIAVSDAANNPTHVFARDWDSTIERSQTLAALEKLAQPVAQQYMTTNHLQPSAAASSAPHLVTAPTPSSTKPAHSTATSAHRSAASHSATHHAKSSKPKPAPPLTFSDETLTGYTLSYGGLPTFVYSAAVPTTTAGPAGPQDGPVVRVTVVAQRLPSGDLQTSLTSATDEAHLDRAPWMRLVDAVDPDDSHRASLLFELRGKNSRQFALYSLASAQAVRTFVTGILE